MLFKKKNRPAAKNGTEEKIVSLQTQREEVKARIRKIRAEMQLLIQQATEADDLDRKVLSMDYEARKSTLAVETEHFNDLSRLIAQLRNIQLEQDRKHIFSGIEDVYSGIDAEELIQTEDELTVRRTMMQEENEQLDSLFSAPVDTQEQFRENEEFSALVRKAKAEKTISARPAAAPLPANKESVPMPT